MRHLTKTMAYNNTISVCVVTYNSSATILETLDSIKNQTYQNLELVITDDASKDNTVEICTKWLEDNVNRFVRSLIVTTPHNTGTVNNLNRGVEQCTGEWIRCIAGDDAFGENFFQDLSVYLDNPEYKFINVPLLVYKGTFEESNHVYDYDSSGCRFFDESTDAALQHKILLRCPIPGTGFVVRRSVYDEVGLYDPKYPFFEDRPFSVRVTDAGIKLHFVPCFGVKYRLSGSSIEQRNKEILSRYHRDSYRFQRDVVSKEVGLIERWILRTRLYLLFKVYKTNKNVLTEKAKRDLKKIEIVNYYAKRIISRRYYRYLEGMQKMR